MLNILRRFRYHLAVFFAVLGPGFITAVVDNDAGGIFTYSSAGAKYGYLPLWTLLPITIVLIMTQEMCSRMGAVTGKGLSDLIREEFGLRITFLLMALLLVVKGNYQSVEKVFLSACVVYIAYIISGILVEPDWKTAAIYSVRPVLMLDAKY